MDRSTVIITAADSRYFEFVRGCINSVNQHRAKSKYSLAMFDLGCTLEHQQWLRANVDFVCEPHWNFDFPGRNEKPAYLRGLLARPFLREYFPGFETYLWLDADAWVQNWQAIELFDEGARSRRGLAVVPEIDRCSLRQYGGLPEFWNVTAGWYAAVFGNEVAQRLCTYPMLNAGVFALHREAPHWKMWEEAIGLALQSRCSIMTDQLAMNYMVYARGLFQHTEMLPAWCNWTCHNGFPKWDERRNCLVEPYLPHTPIGVMHLTTRDKQPIRRILTTENRELEVHVMYPPRPVPALEPDSLEHRIKLGAALAQIGKLDEAVVALRQALELQGDHAETYRCLGNVLLKDPSRLAEAAAALQAAIELNPNCIPAYNELGYALKYLGRLEESVAAFRRTLELDPNQPNVYNNLSVSLRALGQLSEAAEASRRAIELNPNMAEAHTNLGVVLTDVGKLFEAERAFRRALDIKPAYASAHSRLLFNMQYRPGVTAAQLQEAHAEYDLRHTASLKSKQPCEYGSWDSERLLTIGFVSDGFGLHPMGYFLIRCLENIDRARFRIVCYSDRTKKDQLTERFQSQACDWREIFNRDSALVAEQIRQDNVDILFDLSGHVGGHRMQLFARKPAPVQVTWMGYVGTTGLAAMDYLMADRYHVPPGTEQYYCEHVLRLPDGYICYDPPKYAPEVGSLPARRNDYITFGNFGQPAKLNESVVAVWSQLLLRMKRSKLLLKYNGFSDPGVVAHYRHLFAARGVEADRIEMEGKSQHSDLLASYNRVDIALDTFPYSGGLTTCEALWMGVPVITLPGQTFAGRHSQSHLNNVGLSEMVAGDQQEFVTLAQELASNWERLEQLRATLRSRMAASPLCDGPRFARNWSELMRGIWQRRCARELVAVP